MGVLFRFLKSYLIRIRMLCSDSLARSQTEGLHDGNICLRIRLEVWNSSHTGLDMRDVSHFLSALSPRDRARRNCNVDNSGTSLSQMPPVAIRTCTQSNGDCCSKDLVRLLLVSPVDSGD